MNTLHRLALRASAQPRPADPLRRSCRGLAMIALLGLCATCVTALANAHDIEKPGAPAHAAPPLSAAVEQGMRVRPPQEEWDSLARAGFSSAERERAEMAALGFSADDPVALAAYRAEVDADPHAVAAAGDFVLNTAWGSGGLYGERYAGSSSGTYRGIKAAMLSSGETVVIGQVQWSAGGAKQLGITKRAANGSRAVWTGVSSDFGHSGKQYIVYPNAVATLPPIYGVHDLKVVGSRFYVLVTGKLTTPSLYAPNVLCFNNDGSACGWWFAYPDTAFINDAVAMDIYQGKLVVLGRHGADESGGFWTATWSIDFGDGSLGALNITDFPTPGGHTVTWPADIAFRRSASGLADYYVLYNWRVFPSIPSDTNVNPCLFAVKFNGTPDTTFGASGLRCTYFDEPGGTSRDIGVALTTNAWGTIGDTHEGIQVLVDVALATDPGIGMWELLDRVNHPRFGAAGSHGRNGGRIVFGGCGQDNAGEGCFRLGLSAQHRGRDLAIVGSDMVVAGYRHGNGFLGSSVRKYSPLIARVQGDSGEVLQFTTVPSGYSEGPFNSLVARNDHDVIGIGEAIDSAVPASTARTQIMTGLTNAAIDDTIFKNAFEGTGTAMQLRGANIGGMTFAYAHCPSPGAGPTPGGGSPGFPLFDQRLVDYYAGKGMTTLRMLFTWECMQKDLNGSIPAAASGNYKAYFDEFRKAVDYATNAKGMHVVITPWQSSASGGLCGACYRGVKIGTAGPGGVSNADFADFWTKMAHHFRSNPRVGFSLVNEPNSMSTMQWFSAAQAAVTAIRATGAANRIYVPGNGYTAASTWDTNSYDTASEPKRSNAYGWLNARGTGLPLLDPQDNMAIEVHTYVDQNQGGLDNGITSVTAARDHVKHTVDWARARAFKVYLAEIGMYAGNALAMQAWSDFVAYAGANTDTLIGFAWWAGGYPGWWDNAQFPDFSVAPTQADFTGDTVNMTMIQGAFQ